MSGRIRAIDERVARAASALAWSGPDRGVFDRRSVDRVGLTECLERCGDAADQLSRDAAQQRTTSNGSGTGSPTVSMFSARVATPVSPGADRDLAGLGLAALPASKLAGAIEQIDLSVHEVATAHSGKGVLDRFGDWLSDVDPNRRSDGEILGDLKSERRAVDGMLENDRHILSLRVGDPSGDFRVVEVLGDLETASRVIVEVPGMSTGPSQFDGVGHTDARALRAELTNRGLDGSVAVVSWANYQIPQTLPQAMEAGAAQAGGVALSQFVHSLNSAGFAPDMVTVVGHSYGSALLGYAMEDGLGAKTAVAVGSPGMGGADSRAALGSPDTELWVGEADWDLVADTAVLGADPSDAEFGAKTLPTDGSTGHSEYFKPGSQSIRAIVDVAIDEGH